MVFNAGKLGLSGGTLWGTLMLITTLVSVYTGYGVKFLEVFASMYPGYTISITGRIQVK